MAEFEEIVGYHLEQAYRLLGELGALDSDAEALAVRGAERAKQQQDSVGAEVDEFEDDEGEDVDEEEDGDPV